MRKTFWFAENSSSSIQCEKYLGALKIRATKGKICAAQRKAAVFYSCASISALFFFEGEQHFVASCNLRENKAPHPNEDLLLTKSGNAQQTQLQKGSGPTETGSGGN